MAYSKKYITLNDDFQPQYHPYLLARSTSSPCKSGGTGLYTIILRFRKIGRKTSKGSPTTLV